MLRHEGQRQRHRDRRACCGLALLCVAAYAPALFGLGFGAQPFDTDAVALFGPWRQFARQSLERGVLPLWNPHLFCGLPFLANVQTSVLYPPNVVYWVFPLSIAFLLDAIGHNILLACGAFALARALGQSRAASCVAAVAVALGGAVSAHVYVGHFTWHAARAYLPWELWALLLYLRSGQRRYALALAGLLTLQIAAGYPPFVLLGVALCCGLLLARSMAHALRFRMDKARQAETRSGETRSGETRSGLPRGWMANAALVAMLVAVLAAIYILPLREMSRLSVHGSGLPYALAVEVSGSWRSVLRLLIPDFFGGNRREQWSIWEGAWEEAAYGGFLVFVLALGAPFLARMKDEGGTVKDGDAAASSTSSLSTSSFRVHPSSLSPAVPWLWALMLLSLLLAMGDNTPLYRWLFEHIAPLRLTRAPARWLEVWALCAALLAGFSFDALVCRARFKPAPLARDAAATDAAATSGSATSGSATSDAESATRRDAEAHDRQRAGVLQTVLAALCVALALLAGAAALTSPDSPLWMETAQWSKSLRPTRGDAPQARLEVAARLRETAVLQAALAALTAAMFTVLWARWRRAAWPQRANDERSLPRARRVARTLLLSAVALDVLALFWRSATLVTPRRMAEQMAWPPQLTRFYGPSQRWDTVVGFHAFNNNLPLGIDLFNGYDALNGRRYFEFAGAVEGRAVWQDLYQPVVRGPLLRVAGVTHTLSNIPASFIRDGVVVIAPVARHNNWTLWRHTPAWPRLYLTRDVRRIPDGRQLPTLGALARQPCDGAWPVVAALPTFVGVQPSALSSREKIEKWTRDLNTMTVWTQTARPVVLVQSEALYPGWRAWVNGQAVALEPANYLFRAVAVPAGASRTVVVYDSQTFRFAGFVSLCGLALVAAMGAAWLGARRAR